LSEKKKIAPDLYQELHNNFESVLTQLKKDAEVLSDEVAQETVRCDQEIKALNYAILHLELEHEIGKINDETYQSAFKLLQESLKRVKTEKSDLELTKNKLSNILLGDSKETPQKTKVVAAIVNEAPELPEPPVVVYVKEVGKAGI
jgi:formylmethanofuran dehydrogenase subunit E-like metal-binding protein